MNLYEILGIDSSASADDIKKAYRAKCSEFHPDRNPDGEAHMKEVNNAYDILGDEQLRKRYDETGVILKVKSLEEVESEANEVVIEQVMRALDASSTILLDIRIGIGEKIKEVISTINLEVLKFNAEKRLLNKHLTRIPPTTVINKLLIKKINDKITECSTRIHYKEQVLRVFKRALQLNQDVEVIIDDIFNQKSSQGTNDYRLYQLGSDVIRKYVD